MNRNSKNKIRNLTFISLMTAITYIMLFTFLGTIPLGFVSVTIAHIPILVTVHILGLAPGILMGFIFGFLSLIKAYVAINAPLDYLFQNPLLSVLPRVLIPITTYYSNILLKKLFDKYNKNISVAISILIGNFTNTFGVYGIMYLFFGKRVLEITGKNAIVYIIGALSTSTLIKAVIVVIITLPIINALKKAGFNNVVKKK